MLHLPEILLVEDYEADAFLLQIQFRRHHILNPLHLVTDGVAALDFIFARGEFAGRVNEPLPAALILDIRLPKLDGWEVLRVLRQDPRTRDLPVIVLTGSLFRKELEFAALFGAKACLAKPAHISDLRDAFDGCGLHLATAHELAA